MRLRLLLVLAIFAVLTVAATARALACYTPCAAHQNCIQMCFPIDPGKIVN
jgi:hypothetical protein